MQAILTKYLDIAENHRWAAAKLAAKLNWIHDESYADRFVSGALPNSDYAHVFK
jgi:hypothetical protein